MGNPKYNWNQRAEEKRQNPNRHNSGNATPGQEEVIGIIKTTLQDFANAQAMQMSAFFTGNGTNTKTSKDAQNKASNAQPSILGQSDSIYSTLKDLHNNLITDHKKFENSALGSNIKDIKESCMAIKNALYDDNISLMQVLMSALSSKGENTIQFDESQLNSLINALDEKRLSEVMQKVVDAEAKADANLTMAQNYYQSFTDTATKNELNIQKIIDIFKEQSNKDKEEIQNLITTFTDSNKNLADINKEIRENKEKKIAEAKLKLMIEGLDSSTTNALVELSKVNLDKLKENSKNLTIFFNSLKILENVNLSESLNSLKEIGGFLPSIVEWINKIDELSKDSDEVIENINEYLKILEATYKRIDKDFQKIIVTGETAEKVKEANGKIKEALESTNETVVKTSTKEKEIKKSVIAMEGISEFMVTASIVMSIGALIVMMGGGKFIKAALEFGIILGIFEGLVIMPALMFYDMESNALKGIEGLNKFVITCSTVMLIGALFMMLGGGKMVKSALTFGVVLSVFELLVVAPILAFGMVKTNVFESMNEFTRFVVTCTILMTIGALVVSLGGGKILRNALKFGVELAKFEFLVIAPFLLFSLVKKDVFDSVKGFTTVLITTTIILFIGAAVMAMSGGKMVKYAMQFAEVLMKFEAMVIAPFLLFNLLRKQVIDGLKAFGTVVMVCTITLLIGALFMKKPEWVKGALAFTALLMAFEIMVIVPFLIFNKLKGPVMGGLKDFAIVVFVVTTVLMVGAVFMTIDGGKYPLEALKFAGLLFMFEAAVVAPMILFNWIKKDAMTGARDFGLFVALCSFSLITGAFFISQYGVKPIEQYGEILLKFVLWTTGAMLIYSRFSKFMINDAKDFGLFVLLCSASLVIGALFVAKYGIVPPMEFASLLVGFIGLMTVVILGINALFKISGEVQLIAQISTLGTFLLMATASIALGSWVIDKYGWKAVEYAGLLLAFVGGIALVFGLLSLPPLGIMIGFGAATAALLGIGILTLTGSLMLVNLLFELDPGGRKMTENINALNNILKTGIGEAFSNLGEMIFSITFGTLAAIEIGIGLTILSGSLALIHLCIGEDKKALLKDVLSLIGVIGLIGLLSIELTALILPLTTGLVGITLLTQFCLGLTFSLLMINKSVKAMNEVGDISKQAEQIAKNLTSFIDIPDKVKFGNVVDIMRKIARIALITTMVMPMSLAMKAVATSVADMAALKVAIAWDKKGNPTNYRNLKQEDFDLATNNISKLLYTMADAFNIVWEGREIDGKTYKGIKELINNGGRNNPIIRVTEFGIQVGEVIKGVAEGISALAKLHIPTAWDKKGNPIRFRQLDKDDFDAAANGVATILTTMATTFVQLWGGPIDIKLSNGIKSFDKGLSGFITDEDSPFLMMIQFSKDIGSVISGAAEGVGALAKMQIPTAWDKKTGKPIKFRTLDNDDFLNASINISTILTNIIGTLGTLYQRGFNEWGGKPDKNIFDSRGWFSDEPSPIMMVIDASTKISELIGNMGKGIKDMATLQIPTKWDRKTGKPIYYEKLTKQDFIAAGESISSILTNVITAITSNEDLMERAEEAEEAIKAILPISQLISGMAEGIIHLAAGQVPMKWDRKTGKPIEYERLTVTDYKNAGVAIGDVVSCIVEALIKVYTDGSAKTPSIKSILEGDTFKKLVEGIGGTTEFISGVADSIIKIGQGLIPDKWNNEGKPIHYDKINLESAKIALEGVIKDVLRASIDAVINVYYGKDGIEKLIGDSKNSPFLIAVQGIETVTEIVANITDTIIKLGSAIIPDVKAGFDENGKPKGYKHLNVSDAVKNIQKMFRGENGTDGLLTVLCSEMQNIGNTYFSKDGNNISEAITNISQGMSQITEMISDSADVILKISSMSIPTGFNKDGKAKGYTLLNEGVIKDAKKNIILVLTSLLSIFDSDTYKNETDESLKTKLTSLAGYLEGTKTINPEKINNSISNVGSILSQLVEEIEQITESQKNISSLFKYGASKYGKNIKDDKTKEIYIPIFKDLYLIINDFIELNKAISLMPIDNSNLNDEAKVKNIKNNINLTVKSINSIIGSVDDMVGKINEAGGINKIVKFMNASNISSAISTIISSLNSIINNLTQNTTKIGNDIIENYLIKDLSGEDGIGKLYNNITQNLINTKPILELIITDYKYYYDKIKDLKYDESTVKSKFENITDFYIKALNFISESNGILMDKTGIISGDMDSFQNFLKSAIGPFGDEVYDKFNNLNRSIDSMYTTLSKQEDRSKNFNKNTNALQTYIKAINTVELNKLRPLTTLVQELNKLANKLGNLDKLTNTIANDLAEVLRDLVSSLTTAKKTISDAHQLQADREIQIQKAISRVRELMNAPLNINVQANTYNQGDPNSIPSDEDDKKGSETRSERESDDGGPKKSKNGTPRGGSGARQKHTPGT